MKVILLTDIRGVGRKHEVKNVADGYAVNALFPKKLAEPATEAKLKSIADMEAKKQAERAAEIAVHDRMVDTLRDAHLEITARATEKGGLFKAVGAKEVAQAIRAQKSLEFPEKMIVTEPLHSTGEHTVRLASVNKKADITVAIAPIAY